jgi:hypothetical protein
VEAQGRGTLHCHMLIWIKGALNPNEICDRVLKDDEDEFKTKLLSFLDDTISNFIPPDLDSSLSVPATEHHPCTIHGINLKTEPSHWQKHLQKDLHHLVLRCQSHSHSKTCYKYWKGPPDPMDVNKVITDWNLNDDQARAFKIISQHSLQHSPTQLQIYLGGPAGSDKSRVISALKDFFIRRGQDRRF